MILRNRRHMMKASWIQAFSGILIISFLLFFGNILFLVSHQVGLSGEQVQKKLGVYFYLVDAGDKKDETYSQVISLINNLKEQGLETIFYSKQDAFDVLSEKLPNVIGSLEEYGIKNPLPPTLYVLFDNQKEYDTMKTIVLQYESIIVNLSDSLGGVSFGKQEHRVAQVINMMNSVQYLLYFLIGVVILIVISFLLYAIRINFFRFQKQIEVEKLLGASYLQIISPFLFYVFTTLVLSFAIVGGYLFAILHWLNTYFLDVFSESIYAHLPEKMLLIKWSGGEVLIVMILSLLFSSVVLWRLLRKV